MITEERIAEIERRHIPNSYTTGGSPNSIEDFRELTAALRAENARAEDARIALRKICEDTCEGDWEDLCAFCAGKARIARDALAAWEKARAQS
jgi:hypothetical protein